MTQKHTIQIFTMCIIMALLIPAVSAEACSFCEFINISNITRGVTDHWLLTNLSADNHPQYLLADGTRAMTGNLSLDSHFITGLAPPSLSTDAATKGYVDAHTDTSFGSDTQVMYNAGGIVAGSANFTFENITGTVTANYFVGDGSGLTGINAQGTTVNINYTFTGLPGTEANVTNIGNETAALFDITIPKGDTGDTGATGSTGGTGGQVLYFRHAASTDPVTYNGLVPVPTGDTEASDSVVVRNTVGEVLVNSYITNQGYPALTEIPPGLWRFRTYHNVSSNTGVTTAVFKVYNRTADGTETLLFTATSGEITGPTTIEYLTSYVQAEPYPVSLTDRIVVKVYGQTTSSSSLDFRFVHDGTTHTSHIQTVLESAPATSLSFDAIAGENLYKGQAVYISGASGNNPVVLKADNTVTAKSRVVGLIAADTASGATGRVRRAGALTSVDTRNSNANLNPQGQTWSAGDLLFATTGGGLTNIRPASGRSVKAAYTLAGSSANDVLLAYPMENPVWITAASMENVVLRLGDSNSANKVSIRNYADTEIASIDSQGKGSFNGTDMQLKNISSVADPVALQDAATKNYVDAVNTSQNNYANRGYSINVMATASSPADNGVTYFGILPAAPSTTAGQSKVFIRRAGTIKLAEIYSYSVIAGSAETWRMSVSLNGAIDYPIGANQTVATNERIWTNASINIPVAAGDYIQITSVQPDWVTNPVDTTFGGYIYIE